MQTKRIWLARLLIGTVLFLNLQCAVLFLWRPQNYVTGFGVSGAAGEGLVRALGLLFIMWNVPYAFAFSHPLKHRTSLIEATLMQAIGLLGETVILLTGDYSDPAITATVTRFIVFDGGGLVLLVLAYWISRK